MRARVALAVAVLLLLPACATQYQEMGLSGGVAADQMTSDVFRIRARGNGYTRVETVQDYMILKAAETTKSRGGSHFIVMSEADRSRVDTTVTGGYAQSSVVGNRIYTSYTPATASDIFKPGQDAYIKLLTIPAGVQPPPGAISADEIIQFVGSRVRRS